MPLHYQHWFFGQLLNLFEYIRGQRRSGHRGPEPGSRTTFSVPLFRSTISYPMRWTARPMAWASMMRAFSFMSASFVPDFSEFHGERQRFPAKRPTRNASKNRKCPAVLTKRRQGTIILATFLTLQYLWIVSHMSPSRPLRTELKGRLCAALQNRGELYHKN